jgi:predicted unusual protein kinase regulating ubiquinone biosynthesis (AarF/ABC1/UbiB family)
MSLSVQELVAALPPDLEIDREADREWSALVASLGRRPLPLAAPRRLWAFGTIQAKVALAYLAYWIRSGFAAAGDRQRMLDETRLRTALRVVAGMSYLRGIAIKVGQTLANYPNVLPAELAELMGRLNFEAPPMHFALLREHVRNELGGDPEDLFAEFETTAFAAASLGQVHRARLKSGARVAVKVQYPGIARTIDSDLSSLLAVMAPMRLTREWDSLRKQWEDIRQTLHREADYLQEARHLRRAASAFREEDGIVIPLPHEPLTTSRVLTMDYLDGVHIDRYLETHRSPEERDRAGELLMRASFRLAHGARLWYADSNPGNYLFLRDGRLGVIDFGCCREFTPEEWDYYVRTSRAHVQGGAALRESVCRSAGFRDPLSMSEDHVRLLEELSHWYSDYLAIDAPFDFGDEAFMQRGIELFGRVVRERRFQSLPINIWICRQLLGLRALAFRLKARINMRRLFYEESQVLFQ